jgi:hypothetical protein
MQVKNDQDEGLRQPNRMKSTSTGTTVRQKSQGWIVPETENVAVQVGDAEAVVVRLNEAHLQSRPTRMERAAAVNARFAQACATRQMHNKRAGKAQRLTATTQRTWFSVCA